MGDDGIVVHLKGESSSLRLTFILKCFKMKLFNVWDLLQNNLKDRYKKGDMKEVRLATVIGQ